MTLEQKAKAYDEAIEKAKDKLSYGEMRREDVEYLFPSLIESEEEKARKELVEWLKRKLVNPSIGFNPAKMEKWIAWLEKQGNQREQLINKACDVLVNCIEDYMLRRMEVWGEESKKQTLENIRKKLKGCYDNQEN